MAVNCAWLSGVVLLLLTHAAVAETDAPAEASAAAPADDGWLDLSAFLDKKYGFLPIVVPITEPAVGYGAALGLLFLSRPIGDAKAGFGRPDMTVVGGMATENGTNAYFAADIRYWLDDRLQTRVFLLNGDINLDFFGVGSGSGLAEEPLHYNLEPRGTGLETRYRINQTPWWVGLNYQYAKMDVQFKEPEGTPGLPDFQREENIAGLQPSVTHDSRNNPFTPTTGDYMELTAGFYDKALGSDEDFQRVNLLGLYYRPLGQNLFLGLRGEATATFGDAPFYMRPFISLRGVPMVRYQGEAAASVEAELRWQFWKRLSLVGFGGAGVAWNDFEQLENTTDAFAGGLGVRYEIARAYGIHVGIDVAVGPEDVAFYVQVGSAWARP